MRYGVLIVLYLSLCISVKAQDIDIEPYIGAWKTSDHSQTRKAAVFYDRLDREKDTAKYRKTLEALKNYVKKNPDKRIEARVLMYEVFGAMVFQYVNPKYTTLLERAMEIANELKDDQLMAEIYAYYAEVAAFNNHLLYNLKAIELQRRIGFQYFTTVQNRFFIVSNALYHSRDYRQSVQYGLECLKFIGIDKEHWLKKIYILQLDILGAAYKKLGLCDSTVYYYQKILDTLRADPDTEFMQILWTGIARGNIGHCMALKKNYSAAIPLINEYIQNSTQVKDWTNVSMATNFLGNTYYNQKQYGQALEAWQQSFYYSDKANPTDHLLEATKGIADIYKLSGRADSAFHYYDLYHAYADTLDRLLAESKLSAMNARIASDNLQEHLEESQAALNRSKNILHLTIASIILLIVILWLVYNRFRLKNRHKLEMIERKNELAEQGIDNAKKQIAGFMDHIMEKNNLIESMEKQLRDTKESQENKITMERLSQYILVSEEEWEKFRTEFSNAYPLFFPQLRQRLPQITPAEERLSALIYLGINNYQMAKMLGIERESVFRARRRLRQRLNLPNDVDLDDYLHNILKNNPKP
jgi:DNA-binding CsgD family transcriptional regulator